MGREGGEREESREGKGGGGRVNKKTESSFCRLTPSSQSTHAVIRKIEIPRGEEGGGGGGGFSRPELSIPLHTDGGALDNPVPPMQSPTVQGGPDD